MYLRLKLKGCCNLYKSDLGQSAHDGMVQTIPNTSFKDAVVKIALCPCLNPIKFSKKLEVQFTKSLTYPNNKPHFAEKTRTLPLRHEW